MLEQISNQILSFFISSAHADVAAPATAVPQQGSGVSLIMMFVVFFVFIYFAIWRPQTKRAKEQQNLMNSLADGDEVVTAGGILGRIVKLTDGYLVLAIADNVNITVQKATIVNVLPKGTLKSLG